MKPVNRLRAAARRQPTGLPLCFHQSTLPVYARVLAVRLAEALASHATLPSAHTATNTCLHHVSGVLCGCCKVSGTAEGLTGGLDTRRRLNLHCLRRSACRLRVLGAGRCGGHREVDRVSEVLALPNVAPAGRSTALVAFPQCAPMPAEHLMKQLGIHAVFSTQHTEKVCE